MEDNEPVPGATDTPSLPVPVPAPMGRGFWAVMALIVFLVILIVYSQVQGITRPINVNLTGTHWEIVSYTFPGGGQETVPPGGMNISFGLENTTEGNGFIGCIQYSFRYTRSNNSFIISNTTENGVTCSGEGVSGSAADYLGALENASLMRFRSGRLTFYDNGNHPLMVFESLPEN